MKKEITLAGFGGQGILSMGLFLAYAAMSEGKKVVYAPAYGAEMRGGTANCTVTISDKYISSPVAAFPEVAAVMNHPSLDKFEPLVKTNGILLVNDSLVHRAPSRTDLNVFMIPTQEIADKIGFSRGTNMVMLGALLEATNIINTDNIYDYLLKTFKGKYLDKMPWNMAAIKAGMKYINTKITP